MPKSVLHQLFELILKDAVSCCSVCFTLVEKCCHLVQLRVEDGEEFALEACLSTQDWDVLPCKHTCSDLSCFISMGIGVSGWYCHRPAGSSQPVSASI